MNVSDRSEAEPAQYGLLRHGSASPIVLRLERMPGELRANQHPRCANYLSIPGRNACQLLDPRAPLAALAADESKEAASKFGASTDGLNSEAKARAPTTPYKASKLTLSLNLKLRTVFVRLGVAIK